MIYVAIDVGIVNLAVVRAIVEKARLVQITHLQVINLNQLSHARVPRSQCTLHHSRDIFDKVEHCLQEYPTLFEAMDCLLIERQPPGGLVHVEQLLFGRFRSQARLVSPNAMHKWLGINHLTYEQRKLATTQVARPYLERFTEWQRLNRVHDLADALCLLLYTLHKDQQDFDEAEHQRQRAETWDATWAAAPTLDSFFEQFRHGPSPSPPPPPPPPHHPHPPHHPPHHPPLPSTTTQQCPSDTPTISAVAWLARC